MATNPYKAFVPCITPIPDVTSDEDLSDYAVTDPSAGDWRRVGLAPALPGEDFCIDLDGTGKLMAVQFNERILPGKVRDEQLVKEVNRIQALEGRKISKKEYAQLRQQVEFDLLPKAFIRRTVVPILFLRLSPGQHLMLICTSSAKRAEDCCEVLQQVYHEMRPVMLSVHDDVALRFRTLAVDGFLFNEDRQVETGFFSHDSIALKGSEKKVIRIKDKLVADEDVQELLNTELYNVVEIGVEYTDDHEKFKGEHNNQATLTFVVNQNLIFKRIALPGVSTTQVKEDLYAYTVLCAQTYRVMLLKFIEAFGGLSEGVTKTVDEDDEL